MPEHHEEELRSSRIPSSAPGEWKENQVLRECVLRNYPESHARMLKEIFPALATIYGEEYTGADAKYYGSYTKGELRAVMQDLRFIARYLAMVAESGIHESSETDQALGWFADRLAVHIEKLADLVEKKIVRARKKGTGEGA